MIEDFNIPTGWEEATIEKVSVGIDKTNRKFENPEETFFYIDINAIDNQEFQIAQPKTYKWGNAPSRAQQIIQTNDIVFSTVRPYLKNIALVPKEYNKQIASTGFCVIRPFRVSPKYVYFYVLSHHFVQAVNKLAKGTSYPAVTNSIVLGQNILIPPLREQHRIVEKIEELFSDLDNGIANLKLAQNQLKVYRQALLKYAFEGKLTEEWRKENNPEPAEKLLDRIKEEQKKRYEKELIMWNEAIKDWEDKGKAGKRPKKPDANKEIEPFNYMEKLGLSTLPPNWVWIKVGEICNVVRGGSPRPAGDPRYYGGNIPFLKVADLTKDGSVYLRDFENTIKEAGLHKTRQILPNTLLLSNSGATLGVPKITLIEATFNDGIAAFLNLNEKSIKYLYYFWVSQTNRLRKIDQGAAQPNLNTTIISNTEIPLCSYEEQELIVENLETQLSVIEKLEETIIGSLNKFESLRQSILKKAFEGKLVSQDLDDEPAKELLKRIKKEKKKYLAEQKQQKKKAPKKSKKMSKELSIKDVLKAADKPMPAKEVWQQSKHKNDIEEFYAELKKIQQNVKEVKKGTESLLSFVK